MEVTPRHSGGDSQVGAETIGGDGLADDRSGARQQQPRLVRILSVVTVVGVLVIAPLDVKGCSLHGSVFAVAAFGALIVALLGAASLGVAFWGHVDGRRMGWWPLVVFAAGCVPLLVQSHEA